MVEKLLLAAAVLRRRAQENLRRYRDAAHEHVKRGGPRVGTLQTDGEWPTRSPGTAGQRGLHAEAKEVVSMRGRLLRWHSALLLALTIGMVVAPPAAGKKPSPPPKGGKHVLLVDDDKAQCKKADFMTIQAAVTAASPGATILVCAGTYQESVTITKNDLRIRAKGSPGAVVLDGMAQTLLAGFYIQNASGILINGFRIQNFHEAGILLDNGDGNRIRKNVTTGAHHDGIELRLGSSGNRIEHNRVVDNLASNACGIQIRDVGSTSNVVRHNVSMNNNWGIRVGLAATDNVVFHNRSSNNRAFGILNFSGANGTSIKANRAFGNPTGISVQGSSGVTVARNHAFGNALDLQWDGAGSNTFQNHHCTTSAPPGLCH
jgi:parallel beta-helix repeat protein